MSNDPQRPGAGNVDDLQFDRVESAVPPIPGTGEVVTTTTGASAVGAPTGVTVCGACGEPIADAYYEANGKVVCPRCRDAVLASHAGGSGIARFFKATVFGILAGIVGAAIWWAVRAGTGYEVGLIAIVVGIIVGGAVKAGSQGRGGMGYQLLAVLLTYLSISANYVPDIVRALKADSDIGDNLPALIIISAITAVAAPFLGGVKNIIGLLIIGFALYQAWIINRPNRINFNGPYRLASGGAAPGAMYGNPPAPPPMGRA